jgi:hypothetical protein
MAMDFLPCQELNSPRAATLFRNWLPARRVDSLQTVAIDAMMAASSFAANYPFH